MQTYDGDSKLYKDDDLILSLSQASHIVATVYIFTYMKYD